jgi:hypothetical protein
MFNGLHIFLYLLGTAYTVAGIVVLGMALRPSCRICANRHDCPQRLRGPARFILRPFCTRTGTNGTTITSKQFGGVA